MRSVVHDLTAYLCTQTARLMTACLLRRNSYNLVLHKHGDLLYNGVIGVITERLNAIAQEVAQVSDDLLLPVLNQKWTDHQLIMTMVRDILMYMVRSVADEMRSFEWVLTISDANHDTRIEHTSFKNASTQSTIADCTFSVTSLCAT